jgi:hypothetical protein
MIVRIPEGDPSYYLPRPNARGHRPFGNGSAIVIKTSKLFQRCIAYGSLGAALILFLVSPLLVAQPQADGLDRQLQAAIHKEEVVGDLKGAIDLYKSISSLNDENREAAATALLRLAGCQEKLGQNELARNTYERVIRQFSDQPAIRGKARAKLKDLTPQKAQYEGPAFGVATATFPVNAAAGKHVKYSGYIRTEGVTEGWAGLWWRADGEPGTGALVFDNMQDRGARGTTLWTLYELDLDVPLTAKNINFGVLHAGNGIAWFDTLQISLDGVPFTDNSSFDLDFESSWPRGFYTGGRGYKVELDKEQAHSGRQSLRSRLVARERAKEPNKGN